MTNALQKRLCQRYGINIKIFSAYHLETDSQIKNVNKIIKNYLRVYISHVQDNQVDHLPKAKFAANYYINALKKITPFFADNSFHLCTDIELPQAYQKAGQRAELLAANKIIANQEGKALFLKD